MSEARAVKMVKNVNTGLTITNTRERVKVVNVNEDS